MSPLVAMAGLAEAAAQMDLYIAWAGILLIVGCVIAAWFFRSLIAAVAAIVLLLIFTGLFRPWNLLSLEEDFDPDVNYWNGRFEVVGYAWCVVACIAVVSVVTTFIRYRRAANRRLHLTGTRHA